MHGGGGLWVFVGPIMQVLMSSNIGLKKGALVWVHLPHLDRELVPQELTARSSAPVLLVEIQGGIKQCSETSAVYWDGLSC